MKTRQKKREEAKARAQHYAYDRSKAKRLGTATEEQWAERNRDHISSL